MIGKFLILPLVMVAIALLLGFIPWVVAEFAATLLFLAAGAIMAFGAVVAIILSLEGAATLPSAR